MGNPTGDTPESNSPSEEKPAGKIDSVEDKDWFLSLLVSQANQGMKFGITLFVGGITLTGVLIGAETYFNALADQTEASFANSDPDSDKFGMGKAIVENYRMAARLTAENWKKAAESDNVDDEPFIAYIHLENARIFAPSYNSSAFQPIEGLLWRGRIQAVDGFAMGEMNENPSD